MTSISAKWQHLLKTWLVINLVACGQHQQPAPTPGSPKKTANDSSAVSQPRNSYKNIQEVMSTEKIAIWRHGKLDASARFHFGDPVDTLLIEYYPECWGSYPIKVKNDTIVAFWNADLDTKYNFEVVKVIKKQKVKHGTPFLAFTLCNDTTLNVVYLKEELVNTINATDTTLTFLPKQVTAEPIITE